MNIDGSSQGSSEGYVRVIPCLDVDGGRVVKGVEFVDIRDAGDPVELAKRYEDEGADELVFLDITASTEGRGTTLDMVAATAEVITIPLTVGGGIATVDDVSRLLDVGANKVGLNSAGVRRPELIGEISSTFGSESLVVAIDAKANAECESGYEVFVGGGQVATGIDCASWASEVVRRGAGEILLTSIDADGTKDGYDNLLNRVVSDTVSVPVIASGGVGSLEHFVQGVKDGRVQAVLAASVFHFGEFSISEAKAYMAAAGIDIKPLS